MALVNEHGPLIESGVIDGTSYEVRGEGHPLVHVYRKVGDKWAVKTTQLGDTPLDSLVRMLAAELPR